MKILKPILLFPIVVMVITLHAKAQEIVCQTSFETLALTIKNNNEVELVKKESSQGRSISSINEAVTKKTTSGFEKTFYRDGNKYYISIENLTQFNMDYDFLVVSSPKGHKMTYSLDCESK
jgi:hypothetical protein